MPSPSGSEVKFAQNAKPEPALELDDEELEEDELEEDDELGTTELEDTTVTGGVVLLPPPPPPQPINKTDVAQKPNRRNKYITFLSLFL